MSCRLLQLKVYDEHAICVSFLICIECIQRSLQLDLPLTNFLCMDALISARKYMLQLIVPIVHLKGIGFWVLGSEYFIEFIYV